MYLKITLRRNQLELSKKSAAMAIFLGKNYLGQTDKDDTDVKLTEARTAQIEAGQGSAAVDDETRIEEKAEYIRAVLKDEKE